MDGDDEYGFDGEFTTEDFVHLDEIESAAYRGEFNSDLISAAIRLTVSLLEAHLTCSTHPLKQVCHQIIHFRHRLALRQPWNRCRVSLALFDSLRSNRF
jgi:hypothetical protein